MKMEGKRSRNSENEKIMKKSPRKALKVVYISTPMKVTTSASKFREIVQELTGQESDVARIMEKCDGRDTWTVPDDHDHQHHHHHHHHHHHKGMINNTSSERSVPFMLKDNSNNKKNDNNDGSSPSSSSEEVIEQFDGTVLLRGQDSLFGAFDYSTLLYDQFFHQLDILGSY